MSPPRAEAREGAVLAPRRGRVLGVTSARPGGARAVAARAQAAATNAGRPTRLVLLLVLLPLFGEVFEYVNDVPALYLLTKAWPLLTAPLAVWGAARFAAPYRPLLLVTLLWLVFVSPLVGMVVLGNGVVGAASSTAKVLPLATAFSLPATLALVRADARDLQRAVLWLGAATLAAFLLLALLAPPAAYLRDIDQTKIFLWDETRGYRLYLPVFFGLLSMFALARACWRRPTALRLAAIAAGLAVMVFLYKQRTPLAAAVMVIALSFALHRARWRPAAVAFAAAAALAVAVPALIYLQSKGFADQLGGSLSVRRDEADAAIAFLNAHPVSWIVGAGSATRVGEVSFAQLVGTDYFYLADLGWLGVVFEYGAVGCVLLVLLIASALRLGWRAAAAHPILGGAAFDSMLFFLATSVVTPVVFAPGELAFCMALAAYLLWRNGDALASTPDD